MVTSLTELKTALSTLNVPVAYNHFNAKTSLPYIVYYVDSQNNFFADDKVYAKNKVIQVELYTEFKNETMENNLEAVFTNNELPYEMVLETYISEEKLYMVVYEITI